MAQEVSISSTSEEVQRVYNELLAYGNGFPLVQLPKKFKENQSIGDTTSDSFPLVQLPKKFKDLKALINQSFQRAFPLVQLPKKFKGRKQGYIVQMYSCFH